MSEAKVTLLCFFGLVALGLGAMIPMWLVEVEVSGSTMARSQSVIHIAMLFFVVFSFHWLGRRFSRLREWSTNTFFGVTIMLFAVGFLITLTSSIYMLIPLPAWLHLSGSVILGLLSAACMFSTFGSKPVS